MSGTDLEIQTISPDDVLRSSDTQMELQAIPPMAYIPTSSEGQAGYGLEWLFEEDGSPQT